jgi:hypothetical protein
VLVALVVVFLLSVALSLIGLSLAVRLRTAREEARGTALTALCDAALAEALAGVAAGHSAGAVDHPFGSGSIGSQVEQIDAHHYRITATARYAGKGRTAVADVVRDLSGTRVVHWRRLSG